PAGTAALPLHAALPISFQAAKVFILPKRAGRAAGIDRAAFLIKISSAAQAALELHILGAIAKHQPTRIERQAPVQGELGQPIVRSEEHTSELQSRENLV